MFYIMSVLIVLHAKTGWVLTFCLVAAARGKQEEVADAALGTCPGKAEAKKQGNEQEQN